MIRSRSRRNGSPLQGMMVMSESDATLVLDARAAAGLLLEIFVGDATTAGIQCAPMGAVLRCIHCGSVLIRAVHTPPGPGSTWRTDSRACGGPNNLPQCRPESASADRSRDLGPSLVRC
jgi:hypothetical protein